MTQKTEKMNIFKRAGAIFAIAGGVFLGAFVNTRAADDKPDVKPKKEYVKQPKCDAERSENKEYIERLERSANKMSRDQKMSFIQGRERFLKKLNEKLETKKMNSEERFETLRARRLVVEELAVMRQKLGNER